jgi:hypothetical protein
LTRLPLSDSRLQQKSFIVTYAATLAKMAIKARHSAIRMKSSISKHTTAQTTNRLRHFGRHIHTTHQLDAQQPIATKAIMKFTSFATFAILSGAALVAAADEDRAKSSASASSSVSASADKSASVSADKSDKASTTGAVSDDLLGAAGQRAV